MNARVENRRSALARLVAGGVALITAGLAGLVGLVAAPRATGTGRRWRRAASMFDIPANKPLMVVLSERHADGWYQTREQTIVYLDKDGDSYRAFSASCTHLGCGVQWDDAAKHYTCPCHGCAFARDGQVTAGPPPRALDRLTVRLNQQTAELEVEL